MFSPHFIVIVVITNTIINLHSKYSSNHCWKTIVKLSYETSKVSLESKTSCQTYIVPTWAPRYSNKKTNKEHTQTKITAIQNQNTKKENEKKEKENPTHQKVVKQELTERA